MLTTSKTESDEKTRNVRVSSTAALLLFLSILCFVDYYLLSAMLYWMRSMRETSCQIFYSSSSRVYYQKGMILLFFCIFCLLFFFCLSSLKDMETSSHMLYFTSTVKKWHKLVLRVNCRLLNDFNIYKVPFIIPFDTAARTDIVDCVHGAGSCVLSALTKRSLANQHCVYICFWVYARRTGFVRERRRTLKGTLVCFQVDSKYVVMSMKSHGHCALVSVHCAMYISCIGLGLCTSFNTSSGKMFVDNTANLKSNGL